MLKIILAVLVIAIVAFLGIAATKPDTFRVERSINIKSPPEPIFALLNDHRESVKWSPFEKPDPDMKRIFSGAEKGKGAVYEWDGDKNVGKGRLEITESIEPTKIVMNLDFIKPFKAHNTTEFTLESKGDITHVTWAMYGAQPFTGKLVNMVMNCEEMMGKEFEKGLVSIKSLIENR